MLQWTVAGTRKKHYLFGMLEACNTAAVPQFQPSSSPGTVSSLWRGVFDGMEVLVVTALGEGDLHATTYVKMRNTGAAAMSDVYCKSAAALLCRPCYPCANLFRVVCSQTPG